MADTPIILLTVRGEEDDIVRGLGLGADDYMTKPFSPRQLAAARRRLASNASATWRWIPAAARYRRCTATTQTQQLAIR